MSSPFEKLIQTVHRLRAPGGCPWDREQTHQSLRPYLIEEAYEVLDVLDRIVRPEDLRNESIRLAFREELGDLLMQVVLHSEMTREAGAFDIQDVAAALDEKLVRRHPHVFGDEKADTADSAFKSWEKQKAKEKALRPDPSTLDGLPKGLPALQRTARVIEKATQVGFQWSDLEGPLAKIDEELAELRAEIQNHKKMPSPEAKERIEKELGDLLFSVCNVGHLAGVQPEDALRGTLRRFERRFRFVERGLREQGKRPEDSHLQEMDQLWNEAKLWEKLATDQHIHVWGLTGGIASGKTRVAEVFKKSGLPVIDADQISRDLSAPGGAAHDAILARFGTVDRQKLREQVFQNAAARADLERILHPLIRSETYRRILEAASKHPKRSSSNPLRVIYEAALLIETGRYRDLHGLIVVEADEATRRARISQRDALTDEQVSAVLSSQTDDERRRAAADIVLTNSGTLPELDRQVQKVLAQWRGAR